MVVIEEVKDVERRNVRVFDTGVQRSRSYGWVPDEDQFAALTFTPL